MAREAWSQLKVRYSEGSVLRLLLGYVVGAWAVLEIVVTVSELAGVPLVVPRVFALVLAGGLVVVLGVALARRGVHAMQRASNPTAWGKRRTTFGALAIFLALLPSSFFVSDGSLEWIMWRDAPLLALVSGALAIAMAVAWGVSARLASSGTEGLDTDDPPLESGPAA